MENSQFILTFSTWACHRHVQGLADILVSQNRIQGRCDVEFIISHLVSV